MRADEIFTIKNSIRHAKSCTVETLSVGLWRLNLHTFKLLKKYGTLSLLRHKGAAFDKIFAKFFESRGRKEVY